MSQQTGHAANGTDGPAQVREQSLEPDVERFQLMQLLHCKDELLRQEKLIAHRLRASLQSTTIRVYHYLLACCFRSWKDQIQRTVARRRLVQAKELRVEVALRHACDALIAGLKQATRRRLAESLNELWLHSTSQQLWSSDSRAISSTARPVAFDQVQQNVLHEDDQVLFATPRKLTPCRVLAPSPHLKTPPHARSPFSDASTHATSSSSLALSALVRRGAPTLILRTDSLGGAHIAKILRMLCFRRLSWGFHRLNTFQMAWHFEDPNTPQDDVSMKLSLRRAMHRCQKLEDSLSSEVSWREEAEKRIMAMTDRGEKLEKERALLLKRCEDAQRRGHTLEVQQQELRHSLIKAEEATEGLSVQTTCLERQIEERSVLLRGERRRRENGAFRCKGALDVARSELLRLRVALQDATEKAFVMSTDEFELPASEAIRELRSAWQLERDQWAEACAELQQRAALASEALAAAKEKEAAARETSLTSLAAPLEAVLRQELHEEGRAYRQLCEQLQGRLQRATRLNEELRTDAAQATTVKAVAATDSAILDEAEAYRALVARLQSDLRFERAEREACDRSLESLRSSYKLLLSRTGTGSVWTEIKQ